MKTFGIELVPLNEPLKHYLEALCAGILYFLLVGLIPLGILVTIYLLLFTRLWPLVIIYLIWIWIFDRDIVEQGGRPVEWVVSWTLFKYVVNYFPITAEAVPGFHLDPKRNYLVCSFPHGYLPIGVTAALGTNGSPKAKAIFGQHSLRGTTLKSNYRFPIAREFLLSIYSCSASRKSLDYLLSYPGGGTVTSIFVGGVAEALLCKPGDYHVILKNRKGFAKLALQNGSPVIPLFAFGQNSCYNIVYFPENTIGYKIQQFLKSLTGIAFPLVYGRGFFQNTFGLLPLKNPINLVVGAPIEVEKIAEPTQEDINKLHEVFTEKLQELFNKYKYVYERDPDNCSLIIC